MMPPTMPKYMLEKGEMTEDKWLVCPYCHNDTKLVLARDQFIEQNFVIPTRGIHDVFITNPVRFTCDHCGSEFLVRFKLVDVVLAEHVATKYDVPKASDIQGRFKTLQACAETNDMLRKMRIGTSDDQDATEQGKV